jgi:hypothetical protein
LPILGKNGATHFPNRSPTMTRMTAAQHLASIDANVAAWNANEIDYDEFGVRQRAAWDAIHARGERFVNRVLAIWRQRTYGAA